jgi:hypothetical protein
MNSKSLRWIAALLLPVIFGCAPQVENTTVNETVEWSNGDSVLTLFVHSSAIGCLDGKAGIWMAGELTSSGEASTIDMLVNVDGLEGQAVEIIRPEAFVQEDGLNTAPFEVQLDLPEGDHEVVFCLAQRSEKGLSEEGACLPAREYSRDCGADLEEPTIVARRRQKENENGWYNEPVTVSFSCFDDDSGIETCSEPIVLSEEGAEHSVEGVAVDYDGNRAEVTEGPVRIDLTPPEITFVGARTYLVDEHLEVLCTVRDELSGVSESLCSGNTGEAYMFDLGSYAVVASATDLAGNATQKEGEFTVRATAASVCALVQRFVTERGLQNSLCLNLSNAEAAFASGNSVAGNEQLDAYHEEIDGATDVAVPAQHAGTLLRLSIGLRP